jgi:hypothetical protein
MGLDIEMLREELKKACTYVINHGGFITSGNFGTDGQSALTVEHRCYCPIAALELLRKRRRHSFEFNYDAFVEGFDTELGLADDAVYNALPDRALFVLGQDFRKQYLKEAA